MQTLTQRKGVPVPPAASMMPHLRVAYFLPDEPIPYSMSVAGAEITLSKFKEIVAKKGNYRYVLASCIFVLDLFFFTAKICGFAEKPQNV